MRNPGMAEMVSARQEVAACYRALGKAGMNLGSAGNVSRRTAQGMVITRTGITVDAVAEADTVAMALDGSTQDNIAPSSEWFLHAAIYRAAPEAGAIVHTHADACTALASLAEPLPPFHYMVLEFGGPEVRCAPYVTFGTLELAEVALAALEGRSACLLANHGMVVHARDCAAALEAALRLETLARQYLLARSAGTPRLLTEAEVAAARERLITYRAGR